ncbi:MAG: hypothetical protein HY075_00820 [Deltaproteobacteria bacterium]|nr:hypothetical protein [Deltaproteobacteria bacterium]
MSTNPRITAVFIPSTGSEEELAQAAYLASLADSTPHGRLLSTLAQRKVGELATPAGAQLVTASACEPGVYGIDYGGELLREGPLDAIENWVETVGGYFHNGLRALANQINRRGGHAILVANQSEVLGVIAVNAL